MRIDNDVKLDFDDVLIIPQRSSLSSRSEVDLSRTYKFPHCPRSWSGIGIIASNFDTVGTFEMAKALGKQRMIVALHKFYPVDKLVDFFVENINLWDNVFYTIGANSKDWDKLIQVKEKVSERIREKSIYMEENWEASFPRMLCIDVANGYQEFFSDWVAKSRKEYPNSIIMAGNVVTGNMTEELILNGADIIKIGIGSGSVCRTRIKAGVGFPQLSAIDECSYQAHGLKGHICSDGGITNPGDAAKAFSAGCFYGEEKVKTEQGMKKIKEISVGEKVYTHTGKIQRVKRRIEKNYNGFLLKINGIKCTPNHHFYVIEKASLSLINENNIEKYAKWIPASELTKEYLLIKVKD